MKNIILDSSMVYLHGHFECEQNKVCKISKKSTYCSDCKNFLPFQNVSIIGR